MTDDPQRLRTDRLLDELSELPLDEREAAIAALDEGEREALWAVELERSDDAVPDDYEDLGAGE